MKIPDIFVVYEMQELIQVFLNYILNKQAFEAFGVHIMSICSVTYELLTFWVKTRK